MTPASSAGSAPTGVLATADDRRDPRARGRLRAVHAADARRRRRVPPAESGANVVTTCGEFHHPAGMDPDLRRPRRNRLPARRHLDPQHRQQPRIHLRGRPAGADLDPAPAREPGHRGVRRPVQAELSRAPVRPDGLRVRSGRLRPRPVGPRRAELRPVPPADRRRARPPPRVGGGAVARSLLPAGRWRSPPAGSRRARWPAQRHEGHRHAGGRPLLSFVATWFCTSELESDWDLRPTGWRISVVGDAPLDVEMRFAVPLERHGRLDPGVHGQPCRQRRAVRL